MNRNKALKRLTRKALLVKPCPFCGAVPVFGFRADTEHSAHGSWGHYAKRDACCPATGLGQTELFFCNNFKKPNFGLWYHIGCRLIRDWNRRTT